MYTRPHEPARVRRHTRHDRKAIPLSAVRKLILIVVAIGLAGLFVRLGVWQLERHGERSATDATRRERAALPALDWTEPGSIPADTVGSVGRRVRVVGSWAREHEVILRSRPADGRAGVEVLSPLQVGPDEPAVMVLRGWLPAADGLRADLGAGWTEADRGRVEVRGTLISIPDGRGGPPLWVDVEGRRHLALGDIDLAQVEAELPIEISPHVLRADDPPPGSGPLGPARAIRSGSGPHLSYAVQWFAFAAISLVGTALLLGKEKRR